MIRITDDNYNLYKRVYEEIWVFTFEEKLMSIGINLEYSPINVLNSWEKKK